MPNKIGYASTGPTLFKEKLHCYLFNITYIIIMKQQWHEYLVIKSILINKDLQNIKVIRKKTHIPLF